MAASRGSVRRRLLGRGRRRLGIVALVGCLAVLSAGCDWVQAGYGPGRAYFNPTETMLTASTVGSLDEAFTVTLPVGTSAPPIVVGGSLVVTSRDASTSTGTVSAYDGSTGVVRWTTPLPGALVQVSQPVSIGGRIYATTRDTTGAFQLVALARSSGAVLATTPLASFANGQFATPSLGQVAASDGRLIVVTSQGYGAIPSWAMATVRAIDPDTGDTEWAQTVFTGTGAGVVGSDRGQVTVNYGSNPHPGTPAGTPATVTYDAATGSTQWSHDSGSDFTVIQPSMGSGGQVFAAVQDPSSDARAVLAIDATTGDVAWAAPAVTPLAATADRIIVADFAGGMTALDASSGTSRWSITGAGWEPTIAGAVLYAVDSSAASPVLKTYSVDTGSFIASVPVAIGGRPIVTDGHVYLSNGTTLYAYAPA